jgi:hypothetical protein
VGGSITFDGRKIAELSRIYPDARLAPTARVSGGPEQVPESLPFQLAAGESVAAAIPFFVVAPTKVQDAFRRFTTVRVDDPTGIYERTPSCLPVPPYEPREDDLSGPRIPARPKPRKGDRLRAVLEFEPGPTTSTPITVYPELEPDTLPAPESTIRGWSVAVDVNEDHEPQAIAVGQSVVPDAGFRLATVRFRIWGAETAGPLLDQTRPAGPGSGPACFFLGGLPRRQYFWAAEAKGQTVATGRLAARCNRAAGRPHRVQALEVSACIPDWYERPPPPTVVRP